MDWTRARQALHLESGRVPALLRSIRRPSAPALGAWSVADIAVHLCQAWQLLGTMIRRPEEPSPLRRLPDLHREMFALVRDAPERDPAALADRFERQTGELLADIDAMTPWQPQPWLFDGTTIEPSGLLCHLLNETVVHAWDIAAAEGIHWPIERSTAVMVLDGFLLPAVRMLPADLVDPDVARDFRATYELRIRGGEPYLFVFEDGEFTMPAPSARRRVDCHILADPAALLLVSWGRIDQWQAIRRGGLLAWGRKPWLATKFRALLRNP